MKKIILNPTILSFLPLLIFFPLSFNLLNNIHFGGFDLFSELIIAALSPKLNSEVIIILINRLVETTFIALSSWIISYIFGIFFGLISSNLFYEIFNWPIIFSKIIKLILILLRSIHESIWGIILLQIYGINISVGIIAICIPYIAINSKIISEQLENIDQNIIKSTLAINGPKLSSLITLIWNPILYNFKTFGIYRLECAVRSTTIIGLFGLGGIGTSIYLAFQALSFRELSTYIWGLALFLIILKIAFKFLIAKKIDPKISLTLFISLLILSFYSIYYFFNFIVNPSFDLNFSIDNLYFLKEYLNLYDFLKLIFETIILSISATAISISLPPFCLLIFNSSFSHNLIKSIGFCFRLIPPPIMILVLLMFNSPSISLAALSLGLYNASITNKLLTSNLNNINKDKLIAMNSISSSRRISWLIGLFSQQAKSYLIYCAYRSDIIIRETAIIGIIGGIGLGWQLQESISSFAWEEVALILFTYSSIAIIGELINGKIKENFI